MNSISPRYLVTSVLEMTSRDPLPVNDIIVELVQSLQQIELFLDLVELWLFRVREAEEVLSDGVGAVFSPQCVEVVLEHLEAV